MGRNGWLGYLGSRATKWTLLIKSGSYSSLGLLVLAPSVTLWGLQVYLTYSGWRGYQGEVGREEPSGNTSSLNLQVLKWDKKILFTAATQKHH